MMKKTICILAVLISGLYLHAQNEMSLPSLNGLWQRNWINPAISPDEDGFILSLPSVYFGFDHSGKPFKDVWSVSNHTLFLDTDKWVDNLNDENEFFSRFELPTLQLAWHRRGWTWSVGHTFINQLAFNYQKDLIELIHYGNAPYIGETLEIGIGGEWTSLSSFHLGIARETEKFSIGGRIHLLNGIQYLNIDPGDVSLFTNDDVYQLEFRTDIELLSSSFISADDVDALDFELTGIEVFDLFTSNKGLAFDLGVSIDLSDDLVAEASILDIGFVNWKDATIYRSKGEFIYEGAEVSDLANFDTLNFRESLDTIGKILNVEEVDKKDFNTNLAPRMYINLHWQVNDKLRLSALYANDANITLGQINAFGIGAHYHVLENWGIGTVISNRLENWHWGLNTRFRLGFAEIYLISDNILSSFDLDALGNGNVRAGLNFVF